MAKHKNLHTAKAVKNDEFYTRYEDIQDEVFCYKDFFEGKTVLCNCDDPLESNFTKYFILRFRFLKLKKLICTFYDINGKAAYVFTYEGQDINNDGIINEEDINEMVKMQAFRHRLVDDMGFDFEHKEECWAKGIYGSGDFRSQHCIEYLKMADVVVTNPPFSLWHQYIKQLIDYNKKFLVIGNLTLVGRKEIFPFLNNNYMWTGKHNVTKFIQPNKEIKGVASRWFTNIGMPKTSQFIDLYKKYDENNYIKYGNFDAIEISLVQDIPYDYDGIMAVPVSIIDNFNPLQFEIIGVNTDNSQLKELGSKPMGQKIIDFMHSQGNFSHVTKNSVELYYITKEGKFKRAFERLLIRKRTA